jgi:hypothetical protein
MSGYSAPSDISDRASEIEKKLAIVEVSNEWVSCARSKGVPEIEDLPLPVIDDWSTFPTALLPPTTTKEQLEALLVSCPVFDADILREWEERAAVDPSIESPMFPSVGFDVPGFDGDTSRVPLEEDSERLQEMMMLLLEPEAEYHNG